MGKEMNYDNNYVSINFTDFPQVVIAIKDHTPTQVEFEEFLDAMKRTYDNEMNRIVLFDLVNARNVPLLFQLKFARWSKNMEPIFDKHLKGVTFYVNNKLIKNLLKSIFFVQKPNYEYQVFDNRESVDLHQSLLSQRYL